ncbi:MAG: PorT family protein [Cyclobacteriaceae bacterium]|nr:PorT family protein [Cyclobacteriaceae bacterium]
MKKGLLVLAIAFFAMSSVFAQVSGGLKAGLNLANITGEGDYDMKAGFHVGAFVDLSISDAFSLQPELLFSTQGAQYTFIPQDDEVTAKFNLNYLNLPILAKVKIGEVFNIHAGPQFGFLLSAKEKRDDESYDFKDQLKTVDVGLAFGVGVDLPMGLTFAGRYNLGLTDIADENDGDPIKNSVIQVSVGYKLFGK